MKEMFSFVLNIASPLLLIYGDVKVALRCPIKLRWCLVSSLARLSPIKAEGQMDRGVY